LAERLSLIAGSGALVPEVIHAAQSRGYELQVLSLQGRRSLHGMPAVPFDVTDPAASFGQVKAFGAGLLSMAGGLRLSDRARESLLRFAGAGDNLSVGDADLSSFAHRLTDVTGARLVGVHEIEPDLMAPEGQIAGPELNAALRATAEFALGLARRAGRIDLGQGIVVSGRRAIATEDVAGTDALLKRVQMYRRFGLAADSRSQLVFAKAAKPGQPVVVDLPAIGPRTIANARKAGIALIVVQAGATILIERQKLIAAANKAGIPVIGLAASDD
jgi:DUF1009 family protein